MLRTLAFRALLPFAAALGATVASIASASAPGAQAPDFAVADAAGKPVKLADYRGKFVVLEWTNPECPFVRKHYDSKNMQGLQALWGAQDVVWLSINSTRDTCWLQPSTPPAVLAQSETCP